MAKNEKVKTRFYITLLFVICLVFFLPFLIRPDFLTTRDNVLGRTYIPLFSFIRNSFFTYKQIPLWRPDQLMGEPFIDNPLSSLFYPANLLFLIFSVKFASVVYLFSHFLLVGIFTYLLASSFNFSSLSSFAAACLYVFSTKMLLHLSAGHITMIAAFSYFPLVFLSTRKIILQSESVWVVIGAISLTFMLVTYPTIFYYAVIFIIIYWLYHVLINRWMTKDLKLKELEREIVKIILLFIVLLGLSAIFLLPQAEFTPLSTRSQLKLEDVAQPLWNLKRFLTSFTFPYLNFESFDHESLLYLGIVPSLLFVVGFLRLSNIKKFFLASISFTTLLFVAGLSTPIFKLAYDFMPFLKYTRITTRLWFIVALVVALIAAYGLEKIKRKSFIYLILIVFLIESFFIGYRKIISVPNLSFKNEALYQYLTSDQDLFRVYCTTYCFNPQLISTYKIQVLHGETPIQDADFIKFLAKAGGYEYSKFAVIFPPYQVWQRDNPPQPNAYLLGLANVKYVASTYPVKDTDLIFVNEFDRIYLYQNRKFKPRVYFSNVADGVTITKYSPNNISVNFSSSSRPRTLIFSELFYPGWIVNADHQKLTVLNQEPLFRKVIVPQNKNSLEINYKPESFTIGKTISLSTITFLILWYIRKRQQKSLR